MDLHHIRYFVAVVDSGTIAGAAEYIGISASPLSRRIRDLEKHMGGELFTRTQSGMLLTSLGERLLPLARRLLEDYEPIDQLRTYLPGRFPLRVGLIPGMTPELSMSLPRALQKLCPDVKIEFMPGGSAEQYEWLRQGQLDIALVRIFESDRRLAQRYFTRDELLLLAANESAKDLPPIVTPGSLEGWTLISQFPLNYSDGLLSFLEEHRIDDVRIVPNADHWGLGVLAGRPNTLTISSPGRVPPGLTQVNTSSPVFLRTDIVWRKERTDIEEIVESLLVELADVTFPAAADQTGRLALPT